MNELVSERDLRNRGGAVIDADLAVATELIRRRKALPSVDPSALRSDIDELLDASL